MKKKSFLLLLSLGVLMGLVVNMLGAIEVGAAARVRFAALSTKTENNELTNEPVEIRFDEEELADIIESETEESEIVQEEAAVNRGETEILAEWATALVEEQSAAEPVVEPVAESIVQPVEQPVEQPVVQPIPVEPANNIKIAGKTLEIIDVADTAVDAGGHVNRYGAKFLYGHNSSAVFGAIVNLGEGATFSVTMNEVTTNYRVAKTVIFEKNVETGRLQLNGNGNYMGLVAKAKHNGVQYDLSIMTCYGTSYGNGDASHRFVIFANAM